jgi:hypothetical protein
MGKAVAVHRAFAAAIHLARLGGTLPQGILAARQRPACGKPVAFIEIVSQPVGWSMKPFREPDALLAAQKNNLLVTLFHLPRFGRVVELNREVDRESGKFSAEFEVFQRHLQGRPHVQGPALGAAVDLVGFPGAIRHGQAVGATTQFMAKAPA